MKRVNQLIVCSSFVIIALLFNFCQPKSTEKVNNNLFYITDFGAVADGKTLNTAAIQAAIDKAAETHATVVVPAGTFLLGTVFLKSNVTLDIQTGATLLGSTNIEDYKEMTWGHNQDRQPYHLIVAQNVENIKIQGKGTVDGNGEAFWEEYEKDAQGNMITPRWILPKAKKISPLIEIVGCKNVTITEITIKTGGGWNLHLHDCDLVKVDGINIINNLFSPNSDGIDITGCHDVMISNCYIKTCDDAICLKTTPDSRDCRRVTVTNCILETLCVGLKLGCNESFKDMSDVTFSNCVVNGSSRAFGIYTLEGGVYDRININNITANTNAPLVFNRPIQLMVGKKKPESKLGAIKNVTISNFTCETDGRIMMTASEDGIIENIIFRDVNLTYPWIENPAPIAPEATSNQFPSPKLHPEAGTAQAAIVAENINNLIVDNLIVNWTTADTIPAAWKHAERIENGSKRIHRYDYTKPKQTEFAVLWGKNLKGGYLNAPLAQPSNSSKSKYELIQSTIKLKE